MTQSRNHTTNTLIGTDAQIITLLFVVDILLVSHLIIHSYHLHIRTCKSRGLLEAASKRVGGAVLVPGLDGPRTVQTSSQLLRLLVNERSDGHWVPFGLLEQSLGGRSSMSLVRGLSLEECDVAELIERTRALSFRQHPMFMICLVSAKDCRLHGGTDTRLASRAHRHPLS